jgi:hypothetical protein
LFSLPGFKHPHYLLPSIPAVFILASTTDVPEWAKRVTAAALGIAAVAALFFIRIAPFGASVALLLAAAALVVGAVCALRDRIVGSAAFLGVSVALALGIALPQITPPLVTPALVEATENKATWIYGRAAGLWPFGLGRPIGRAWSEDDVSAAVDRGEAVIMSVAAMEGLSSHLRSRVSPAVSWPVIGSPAATHVASALLEGDATPMYQEMVLLVRTDAQGSTPGVKMGLR